MSFVVVIYKGKRVKIECYWYRDGYVELAEAIQSRFCIKHEIELKLHDESRNIYIKIKKKQMSEIPKGSTVKVIDPNAPQSKCISTDKISKMRKQWKVGSKCEIYSEAHEKWIEGEIENIFMDLEGEWLEIRYMSINTKHVERFSGYIRPTVHSPHKESEPCNQKLQKHKMYVIGNSEYGELALMRYVAKELRPSLHTKHIETIQSGNKYSVYCDYYNQLFWLSGCNENGECGIGTNESVHKLTLMQYFRQRNIKIKKVFANVCGSSTFWLTFENNNVYGNGCNRYYQLGLLDDNENKYEPVLIDSLFNVIDIKSAQYFCVALCDHSYVIIDYWYKRNKCKNMEIPLVIFTLVKTFYGIKSRVYTTKHEFGANKGKWTKMDMCCSECSRGEIIKIEVGLTHCFCLSAEGVLLVFGEPGHVLLDNAGKLGLGRLGYGAQPINIAKRVEEFVANNINILDVSCGAEHTLAIDDKYRIYAWGANKFGQCGSSSSGRTVIPAVIDTLRHRQIKSIKCGFSHSLACTFDNEYFLWGTNKNNECVVPNKEYADEQNKKQCQKQPCLINEIIQQKCDGWKVKGIYLGCRNTKLLVIHS